MWKKVLSFIVRASVADYRITITGVLKCSTKHSHINSNFISFESLEINSIFNSHLVSNFSLRSPQLVSAAKMKRNESCVVACILCAHYYTNMYIPDWNVRATCCCCCCLSSHLQSSTAFFYFWKSEFNWKSTLTGSISKSNGHALKRYTHSPLDGKRNPWLRASEWEVNLFDRFKMNFFSSTIVDERNERS